MAPRAPEWTPYVSVAQGLQLYDTNHAATRRILEGGETPERGCVIYTYRNALHFLPCCIWLHTLHTRRITHFQKCIRVHYTCIHMHTHGPLYAFPNCITAYDCIRLHTMCCIRLHTEGRAAYTAYETHTEISEMLCMRLVCSVCSRMQHGKKCSASR